MNPSTTLNYNNPQAQSKLTRKGQITIPSNIRKLLKLQKGDKIAFLTTKNQQVEIQKKPSIVTQTAGIFKSTLLPQTAHQMRDEVEQTIAKETIQRSS